MTDRAHIGRGVAEATRTKLDPTREGGRPLQRSLGLISDAESGGTHTSRTIMLRELRMLLGSTSPDASFDDLAAAVLTGNVLAKQTENTRVRSLRYLREL